MSLYFPDTPLISQSQQADRPLANLTVFGHNNSTSRNSSNQFGGDGSSDSGKALAIVWIMCLLLVLCVRPNASDERYRLHGRGQRGSRGDLNSPDKRKERIEQSLSVKRVIAANEQGNLTLGEPIMTDATPYRDDTSTSYHSMEENEETSTCVICLEPFRVGDTVAWSKQSAADAPCLHVFHRNCILPWLEDSKHDDCPCCRSIILQDATVSRTENDNENCLEVDDALEDAGANSMAFVIIHGLVSRARRASYSIIGQHIIVGGIESDEIDDDNVEAGHLSQPSRLRRVFSMGERRPSVPKRLRISLQQMRSASIGNGDDGRLSPLPLVDNLEKPLNLRIVVSVGAGGATFRPRDEESLNYTCNDPDEIVHRPSRFPLFWRTSSSIHSRFSRTQSAERSEDDELEIRVVRPSVSWRDIYRYQSQVSTAEVEGIIEEV